MKRVFITILCLLFVTTFCYAQTARQSSTATVQTIAQQATTNFANISVQGLDVEGNPGTIQMISNSSWWRGSAGRTAGANPITWYLWVDQDGTLCMASQVTAELQSTFPDGDWDGSVTCTAVGSQS